jgi:hypothetical protein
MDGLLRLPRTANNSAQQIIQCPTIKIRFGPSLKNLPTVPTIWLSKPRSLYLASSRTEGRIGNTEQTLSLARQYRPFQDSGGGAWN